MVHVFGQDKAARTAAVVVQDFAVGVRNQVVLQTVDYEGWTSHLLYLFLIVKSLLDQVL